MEEIKIIRESFSIKGYCFSNGLVKLLTCDKMGNETDVRLQVEEAKQLGQWLIQMSER